MTLYFALQMLAWQSAFRTFGWQDVIGDTEILIKECGYLASLMP